MCTLSLLFPAAHHNIRIRAATNQVLQALVAPLLHLPLFSVVYHTQLLLAMGPILISYCLRLRGSDVWDCGL